MSFFSKIQFPKKNNSCELTHNVEVNWVQAVDAKFINATVNKPKKGEIKTRVLVKATDLVGVSFTQCAR